MSVCVTMSVVSLLYTSMSSKKYCISFWRNWFEWAKAGGSSCSFSFLLSRIILELSHCPAPSLNCETSQCLMSTSLGSPVSGRKRTLSGLESRGCWNLLSHTSLPRWGEETRELVRRREVHRNKAHISKNPIRLFNKHSYWTGKGRNPRKTFQVPLQTLSQTFYLQTPLKSKGEKWIFLVKMFFMITRTIFFFFAFSWK